MDLFFLKEKAKIKRGENIPSNNPQLNVVLDKEVFEALDKISRKKGISRSLLARDLIKEALEIYEDIYWDKAAQKRDESFSLESSLSHDEVWD